MTDCFELIAVGGGPAGLSAVEGFRDAGGTGPVAIVADEQRMPYERPPLTKELLRDETTEDALPLRDEHRLWELGISLIGGRAVSLDPQARRVVLSGGRTLRYASCALTTGAEPVRLPIPGADDPDVRVLRSLDQLRELRARLVDRPVVVVGSGFIGCEIAASLARRGHAVTLVSDEPLPNVRRLGAQAARTIAAWLRDEGVELALGVEVEAIERRDGELHLTAGERRLRAPVVVMAVGVTPRSELVTDLLELRERAIPVDDAMRTALPGVLAAGDVAFAENAAAGRSLRVEHWGDALGQGAIAGATAAGAPERWRAVPGFWSTIGDRTLKFAAWGDGFDDASWTAEGHGFVVRYARGGRLVGILAHDDDAAYEQGRDEIAAGARRAA